MSVFFDLPDELCKGIIAESMDMVDLVRMDAALCSHNWRKQWLQFLPNFKEVEGISVRELPKLKWMNARNIKVTQLYLGAGVSEFGLLEAIVSHWNHITTLETSLTDSNYIHTCPNLTSLTVQSGVNLATFNDSIFSKTTLNSYGYGNAPSKLSAICLHCRNLTHLTYHFPPTPETNALLVDIFRLNDKLSSVGLSVDMELLQLLSPHSTSLRQIYVRADTINCDALVYMLEHLAVVECVTIRCTNGYSIIHYDKKKPELYVIGKYNKYTSLARLASRLADLREICWCTQNYGDVALKDIVLKSCNTLTSLDSQCIMPDTQLKSLLSKCTVLKMLSWQCDKNNWSEIMSEANQLEELSVSGSSKEMVYLLQTCRYLKKAYFTSNDSVSFMYVPPLICAIRDYRHAITGLPLSHCECIFESHDSAQDCLLYDGEFSGNLWEEYKGLKDFLLGEMT